MTARIRYRLSPPHGDRIYWQNTQRIDSRVEEISCDRNWFWRGLNTTTEKGTD